MSTRFPTPQTLERGRIAVFLAVTFGLSWSGAVVLYLTGGLTGSPELVPGITLAMVVLPTVYMFGPAVGNVAARLATGEGKEQLRFRPQTDGTLQYYAAAWVVPAALVLAGAGLYFLAFPGQFDLTMQAYRESAAQAGARTDPLRIALVQIGVAVTLAPLLNALFAFGEEFGWRGYLLPKLAPLGTRRAVLIHGVIWGVWHWPILAMGYNYGTGYPGFPWTGMLVFLAFTVGAGAFLARLTAGEGSVWPASIGHGAINAIGGISLLFLAGESNSLLGPTPVGLLAALPWLVLVAWLLRDPTWLEG